MFYQRLLDDIQYLTDLLAGLANDLGVRQELLPARRIQERYHELGVV
jgi:hypothetical protein